MMKKSVSMLLALVLLLSCLPVTAFAGTVASGTCGENLTWELTDDGTLTISGTGAMTVHSAASEYPWYEYKEQITAVVVSEGVTNIGQSAFYGYKSLTGVYIAGTVQDIGLTAFSGCSALTELTLCEGIQFIQKAAFAFCSALTQVTIPASVVEMGSYVFEFCAALNITVAEGNLVYMAEDNIVYTADRSTLLFAGGAISGDIVIPEGVSFIQNSAFKSCDEITSVFVPEGVEDIGAYAFDGCGKLTEVYISEGIPCIHSNTFSYCESLTTVYLPVSVTDIYYRAFEESANLTDIYYAGTAQQWRQVNKYAENEELTYATVHCYEVLASGTCGANLTWQYDSNGLLKISGTGDMTDYFTIGEVPWARYRSQVKSIELPEGLTSIGGCAFVLCSGVTEVIIPEAVSSIGQLAFHSCSGLTELTIPQAVTSIGSAAFYGCTGLQEIQINCAAPELGENVMANVTATVYYPGGMGWTEEVIASLNGSCRWVCYCVDDVHTFGDYVSNGDATCTENGTQTALCIYCGAADTRPQENSALGHDHRKGVCVRCGDTVPYLYAPVVSVTNLASSGKIKLSWDAVDGAVEYRVYRSQGENGAYNLIDTTASVKYTDASAKSGQTYCYYIVAVDADGDLSETSAVVRAFCKLPRPVVTAANVASSGKIKLTWDAVEGAVEYKVYRAASKNGEYMLVKTTASTSYTNTSAVAEKTYYYKVVAVGGSSEANSAYSSVVSRTCDLPRPVVTATNVASSGKIKLTWGAVEGAVEYKVYRAASKNGEYKLMKTTTSTSYTNSSAVAGTTYYYKVIAVSSKSAANSAYSSVVSRTCDCAQPQVKVSKASTTSIKISWGSVSGAKNYTVYRATSKDGTYKKLTTTTSKSYTDKNVTAGKTYYYKVVANHSKSAAKSAYSEIVTAKATITTPTLSTSVTSTSSSIKISWDQVSGASGYYVYRRSSTSNSWKKVGTVTSGSTTSFTDSSVSGRYYYCVAAYKTVNGKKYTSLKSEAIRPRTLGRPSSVTASVVSGQNQNTVSWSAVSNATGYQVYYKAGEKGTWKKAATVSGVTSYTHENVERGVYYYYKVRALYKNDGLTCYGSFRESASGAIHCDPPDVTVIMTANSDYSANGVAIFLYNGGESTLYIYREGGQWLDYEYTNFNRNIVISEAIGEDGKVVVTDEYISVAAGAGVSLVVNTDSQTVYRKYTRIYLRMRYEGVNYATYSSNYYGFRYSAV